MKNIFGQPIGDALIEIKSYAQSRQGNDCQLENEGGLIILHVDGPPLPTLLPSKAQFVRFSLSKTLLP